MSLTMRYALLPTLALAALAGVARADCAGDCDGNGAVAINELILGVSIALGSTDVSACPAIDADGHGDVTINELITMVNVALGNFSVSACLAGDPNHDGAIAINELVTAVGNAINRCP